MKQLGLGIIQYTQDYDETMVPAYRDGIFAIVGGDFAGPGSATSPVEGGHRKWMDMIYPYVKSTEVYNCPSAKSNYLKYAFESSALGVTYGHYAINMVYYNTAGVTQPFSEYRALNAANAAAGVFFRSRTVRLSAFADPARTVEITDWRCGNYAPYLMFGTTATTGVSSLDDMPVLGDTANVAAGMAQARHLETTNVLFADGHVKAMKPDALNKRNSSNLLHLFSIESDE